MNFRSVQKQKRATLRPFYEKKKVLLATLPSFKKFIPLSWGFGPRPNPVRLQT